MDSLGSRIESLRWIAQSEARRYCRSRRLRGAAVDEVEADALVGLWRGLRTFHEGAGASTEQHLRRRSLGAILDGRRAREATRRVERPTFVALGERTLASRYTRPDTDDPESIAAHYANRLGLPDAAPRFALMARGYSPASVARLCGVTDGAVIHTLALARARLRSA